MVKKTNKKHFFSVKAEALVQCESYEVPVSNGKFEDVKLALDTFDIRVGVNISLVKEKHIKILLCSVHVAQCCLALWRQSLYLG